jgi:hypothetical protein
MQGYAPEPDPVATKVLSDFLYKLQDQLPVGGTKLVGVYCNCPCIEPAPKVPVPVGTGGTQLFKILKLFASTTSRYASKGAPLVVVDESNIPFEAKT